MLGFFIRIRTIKVRLHTISHESDARSPAFNLLCAQRNKQRFDLTPLQRRRNWAYATEEQLDLPAATVEFNDSEGGQREVVGDVDKAGNWATQIEQGVQFEAARVSGQQFW